MDKIETYPSTIERLMILKMLISRLLQEKYSERCGLNRKLSLFLAALMNEKQSWYARTIWWLHLHNYSLDGTMYIACKKVEFRFRIFSWFQIFCLNSVCNNNQHYWSILKWKSVCSLITVWQRCASFFAHFLKLKSTLFDGLFSFTSKSVAVYLIKLCSDFAVITWIIN